MDFRWSNQEGLTKKVTIEQRLEDVKEGVMQTFVGRTFQAEETTYQRPQDKSIPAWAGRLRGMGSGAKRFCRVF